MTVIERCRALAEFTEEPGRITRTFLSPPMRGVHDTLRVWMEALGMEVTVDAVGNLRGLLRGTGHGKRLMIGSHVDTVPNAGAFDGVLGVVLGLAIVEGMGARQLTYGIEVVAFSEEEGVRFKTPFIGSRALAGTLSEDVLTLHDSAGVTVAEALRNYGLSPTDTPTVAIDPREYLGYVEFHIEQGPVLESLSLPLGLVTAISGQTRIEMTFNGQANHAGTTPMHLRRDALAAAAQWIVAVEEIARATPGLVATVGRLHVKPGAGNVIAGQAVASLDVRHEDDDIRTNAVRAMIARAREIAAVRHIDVSVAPILEQPAVACDLKLAAALAAAMRAADQAVHRMPSGAGHDAMILAGRMPVAMLFLRSPGGISHHPDESVFAEDVDAAVVVGMRLLEQLEQRHG